MLRRLVDYFFFLLPVIKFKIKERSMEQGIKEGSVVLISKYHYFFRKPKVEDVVVLRDPINLKRFIIKRIKEVKNNKVFVTGDNKVESIDSRQFGWMDKKNILGKVFFKISNS